MKLIYIREIKDLPYYYKDLNMNVWKLSGLSSEPLSILLGLTPMLVEDCTVLCDVTSVWHSCFPTTTQFSLVKMIIWVFSSKL